MITGRDMLEVIRQYGVRDERVFAALEKTDRAGFVPEEWQESAYADRPIPIGFGQTISQPYTVARMIELLIFNFQFSILNSKVLEIGTGSGWQTAILARLFKQVYSVEIIPQLAREAEIRIQKLEIGNIKIKVGDGKKGWEKYSPYDGIIAAADAGEVPEDLIKQLGEGGRIVIPVCSQMRRGTNVNGEMQWESFGPFSFVPLV